MKKLSVFIAAIVCSLLFSIEGKAQSSEDYFVGKWNIVTTGLPNGDAKSFVTLERKEGKLIGSMGEEGKAGKKDFDKVEEKATSVTAYFTSNGYDVYLFLEKKDDNNITGSMMDMFDCTGVRVIETKTESK
jgi:hypothetical protein